MLVPLRRPHGSLLSVGLMGLLAASSAGCGGPDAKSPKALAVPNPFPTKDALESVARSPIKPRPARTVAAVPELRVDTSDVAESSAAEKLLVERSAAGKDITFTRELRCRPRARAISGGARRRPRRACSAIHRRSVRAARARPGWLRTI